MRYIVFVLCLLIAASHLQAQKVTFYALERKSGIPLYTYPDSVKIINKANNKTLVWYNVKFSEPWIDLGTISGINDEPETNSSFAKITCNKYETFLNVNLEENSSLLIRIFDLTGREMDHYRSELSRGGYSFLINSGALKEGAYFINITDGKRSQTVKFIPSGKSDNANTSGIISLIQSGGSILKANEIANTDEFVFIGYAGILKPDTITDYTPIDGKRIYFHFDIIYNKIFSGGFIKLNISKGIHNLSHWEYSYEDGNISIDTNYEYVMNNEFLITQCYGASEWGFTALLGGYCTDHSSPDSSIFFCCDNEKMNADESIDSYTELKLYLDTLKNIIKAIEYNRYEETYIHPSNSPSSGGKKTLKEHFSLKNIPCKIENGKLTAVIKFNSCKDDCVYSYSYYYNYGNYGYQTGDSEDFLGFTNPVDDSSYIEIQLNKY